MRFPNAYKGVKKLFTAELINIAALVLYLVASVFAVLAVQTDPPRESFAALTGTLVLIGSFIAISIGSK